MLGLQQSEMGTVIVKLQEMWQNTYLVMQWFILDSFQALGSV